jgi:parallel beta-helix repeat protein
MINVKDFGAQGDGSTNDQLAIAKALSEAKGKEHETVFFPAGEYFLAKPISLEGVRYLTLKGEEATLRCQGRDGLPKKIGAGGGLRLVGDHITVETLKFRGHLVENYGTQFGYGKLLRLQGNYNVVRNCHFMGGNAGGVEIANGNYNTVTRSIFNACNNHPPKPYMGDYGAIHLIGRCQYNTISDNRILNHRFSGISGYGTGVAGEFSDLYINGNYIESASASRKQNSSMGIYLLNGANRYIEITGNTINKADAECVVIFSKSGAPAEYCKIHNNIILNGAYQGVALRSQNEGGTFRHCSIEGNLIANHAEVAKYDHQMFLERFEQGRITNNTLHGFSKEQGRGIFFQFPPIRNEITNNKVSHQRNGIDFYGKECLLDNNIITHCYRGIRFAYCEGSTITNNLVTECTIPTEYVTAKSQLRLSGNTF